MTVWRKWVFPILKTLLVAAIAVALVKLAFFPDRADAEAAVQPTGGVTEPTVQVVPGSISNEVVLTGTVNADAAVPVKATGAGAVDEVFVQQGATVRAGDKIFDIKVENPVEPVEQVGPDGMPSITTPRPTYRFEKVLAPADGVLSSLGVIPGQQVTIGEVAGQVAPPTFNVSATLPPEQQYRLTAQPSEAVVAIAGGPAPFTCTGLTITTPISGTGGSGRGSRSKRRSRRRSERRRGWGIRRHGRAVPRARRRAGVPGPVGSGEDLRRQRRRRTRRADHGGRRRRRDGRRLARRPRR